MENKKKKKFKILPEKGPSCVSGIYVPVCVCVQGNFVASNYTSNKTRLNSILRVHYIWYDTSSNTINVVQKLDDLKVL